MANTGTEIVLTLKEVLLPYPPGTPTGNTKPNTPGDPDYIAPYTNLTNCPVTADTSCPLFDATGGSGLIEFEFSLLGSVTINPAIASVKIQLYASDGTTLQQEKTYTLPMTPTPNYKVDTFTSVVAGTHIISSVYLDSGAGVIDTCPNLITLTTT